MGDYRIIVRDRDLAPIGQIDDYIEFNAVLKFCDVGQWTLKVQAGRLHSELLQPGCGIIVYRNGVSRPILSGPVQGIQKYWTVDTDSGSGALFVTGSDDNNILASRVVYPDPRQPADQQDRDSDAASDREASWGIEYLVSQNCGTGALGNRRTHGYVTPDGASWPYDKWGPKTAYSYRFDNLRDAVKPLAESGGLGWRNVYDPETRTIRLEVAPVVDRTDTVRFSPDLGNLKQFVYSMTAPKATRVIVAAQGEGKDRYIRTYVDEEAEAYWGLPVETFVDARDVPVKKGQDGNPTLVGDSDSGTTLDSALALMDQRGRDTLALNQAQGNLQVYPVDTPQCTFGVHWWLGDRVTCLVDGSLHQDIVRQVTIADTPDGSTITPNIGNQGTEAPTNFFGEIKALWRRVNELSTRM
ncbi:siphovirus ReqiPepy6 Gp37-like family protein [Streptomyces abikoensis]|uniref:siphovirus ReqiPepy6 Gp37-like family protein n=1 Tax=Streptomyces abikoensis TaxID=97398 RepID=UPI003699E6B9